MNPCVFMDRDGVLNEERGEYTFQPELFVIRPGVPEALTALKNRGYKLIVITNQSGISKGIFTREQMEVCHTILLRNTNYLIDDIFYSPYHPAVTESLSRKPGTLLFEQAIAIHKVDASKSWMIGDSDRDMIPAMKLGIRTIFIGSPQKFPAANAHAPGLPECTDIIT
jgi:D-glycero-D-manno-heptose 1,7-bisphosphate phosphatase